MNPLLGVAAMGGMITAAKDSKGAPPEPPSDPELQSTAGSVSSPRPRKKQGPVGTHEYMAPEASQGKPEAASDVFSFMVILWRLTTRMRPYVSYAGLPVVDNAHESVPEMVHKGKRASFEGTFADMGLDP